MRYAFLLLAMVGFVVGNAITDQIVGGCVVSTVVVVASALIMFVLRRRL